MKLNHPVFKSNDQKAHALLDRRDAERVSVRCRVSYSEQKGARIVTEEGTLKDLSKTGCKIFGPTTRSKGSCLTLILHLEDGQAPFRLNDVTVSSVGKDSFSVKFPKLPAEDRKRLLEVVRKNASLAALDNRRTAFRIA